MSRALALALAFLAALVLAVPAAAELQLPAADVQVAVDHDGSIIVNENITFVGTFHGGYRDIPLREGESISEIAVLEAGSPYERGGSVELGSIDVPGTFNTIPIGDTQRIVWHYSNPSGGPRTFTIAYRLSGLAVAYDDVVDVNLKVWGDQWETRLDRLTAEMILPGPVSGAAFRAWGHPVSVRGDVALGDDRVFLRAVDIPPKQFVELRAVFPRELLDSTAGAKAVSGAALDGIVAEEVEDAAAFEPSR